MKHIAIRTLSLLFFSCSLFLVGMAQDQADEDIIKGIRAHYYGMHKNLKSYTAKTYGNVKVWYKKADIHRINFSMGGYEYDMYFEGSYSKLNFVYVLGKESENRYYFQHMDENTYFPYMERWLENQDIYHLPSEEEYFKRNLEITSLALSVFSELKSEVELPNTNAYKRIKTDIKRIAWQADSLAALNLKVEEESSLAEGSEDEGGGASSHDVKNMYNELGDLVISKSSSFADGGGVVSTSTEQTSYFQNGEKIMTVYEESYQYYGMYFFRYSGKSFNMKIQVKEMYKDGKAICRFSKKIIDDLPMYESYKL